MVHVCRIIFVGLAVLSVATAQFPQPSNPQFPQAPIGNTIQANPNFNQPPNPGGQNLPTLQQQPETPQTGTNLQPGVNTGQNRPNLAQNPMRANPDYICAEGGRTAVAQCFQTNGGFGMDVVVSLLSNGTQGQLPPNHVELKKNLCQGQNMIMSCIVSNIRAFNGTQQCSAPGSFIKLEQETIGLLNGVHQICETGFFPKVPECMRRVNFDMVRCYRQVHLNPALFSAGNSRMEGAVIGDNREISHMFCRARSALFTCQNRVLDSCPGTKEVQILNGQDQESSQKGMDVLCKDVDVYVSGLVCFQSPSNAVQTCANQLVRDLTELSMEQIVQALPAPAYLTQYCRIRIRNLECDAAAWSDICEAAAVGLKREFQCNLLPTVCKNDTQIRDLYTRACSEATFGRALRVTSGVATVAASVMSIVSGLLFFVFLL